MSLIQDDFYPAYGMSPSLSSNVIVTCAYVGNVTTLRTPRYSLTLTIPLLRLAPLCVINSTNESPFRLALHFYYNDPSQLSLISDNSVFSQYCVVTVLCCHL